MKVFRPTAKRLRGRDMQWHFRYNILDALEDYKYTRGALGSEHVRRMRAGEPHVFNLFLPPFQRKFVWTKAQQISFMESVFLDYDLGRIVYVNGEKVWGKPQDHWLIDGQQRLTTLWRFIHNKFPVWGCYFDETWDEEVKYPKGWYTYTHDKKEHQLTPKYHLGEARFPVLEIDEDNEEILRDAYNRMNYGGTPHKESERA